MKNPIGERIAEIRKNKGITQEELAEQANINLRTVQRIETGETQPRGYTLSAICRVLDVNIENLQKYGKVEDKTFFIYLHLSVILGTIIPIGDIIFPLILWLTKRDKIKELDVQGKNLILFRVIHHLTLFVSAVIAIYLHMPIKAVNLKAVLGWILAILVITTVVYPIIAAVSVKNSKTLKSYYPKFFR